MIDTPRHAGAWQDPIVAEVRAARQALFVAAGCDIREFCRRLREEQDVSGHPVVTRASKSGVPRPEDAA
jgi:predicted outer membrane protein